MRVSLLFLLLLGCTQTPAPLPTQVVWSNFPERGRHEWAVLFQEKFHSSDFAIVYVHGTSIKGGKMLLYPDDSKIPLDAESVAWAVKRICGVRRVVLLSCNEGNAYVNVAGVWSATNDVWTIPGDWSRGDKCNVGDTRGFKEGFDPISWFGR